jgi:hypothetical protein
MKLQMRNVLVAVTWSLVTVLPLTARSDSSSDWSIIASPNASMLDNALVSVAGSNPNDVWAVGQYVPEYGPNHTNTLTLHYDGSAWSVVPSPSAATRDWREPQRSAFDLLGKLMRASLDELTVAFARKDGVVRVRMWLFGRLDGGDLLGLKAETTET